jgi:hypothetical protein
MENDSDLEGFGGADIDKNEGYKYFKLVMPKKGEGPTEFVCRLLPTMHSAKTDPKKWRVFHSQHYGYVGVNREKPDSPRARPFGCIRKKGRGGVIEIECTKCKQVEFFQNKRKLREAAILAEHPEWTEKDGAFKEVRKNDPEYRKYNDWLQKHNVSKKFWINVMNPAGEYGVLQLSYTTCEKKLMPLLTTLREEGYDAFNPKSGLWLKFTRSATSFNDVDDAIEVVTEVVTTDTGKKAKIYKEAPMTADQIRGALKTCPDLLKGVVKYITADQIDRLVKCSGDPEEVDAIWPQPGSDKKGPGLKPAALDDALLDEDQPETMAPTPELIEQPALTTLATTPVSDARTKQTFVEESPETEDDEAALTARIKKIQADKAAKAASTAVVTAPPAAVVTNEEEFLAQFNK